MQLKLEPPPSPRLRTDSQESDDMNSSNSSRAKTNSSTRHTLRHLLTAISIAINGCYFLWPQQPNLLNRILAEDDSPFSTRTAVPNVSSNMVYASTPDGLTPKAKGMLENLVDDLTTSWSAQDGISSADRKGFDLRFQSSKNSDCSCDLVSRNCLHVIACRKNDTPQKRQALAWIGRELRQAIKDTSSFQTDPVGNERKPIGKLLQYTTMSTWQHWRKSNSFNLYNTQTANIFIQPDWYPACRSGLKGASCFFQSAAGQQEDSGVLEDEAQRWYQKNTTNDAKTTQLVIGKTLKEFLRKHQPRVSEQKYVQYPGAHFSALGNLMMFAHIARMKFNRRPFLDQIYKEKLTVVPGSKKNPRQNNNPHTDEPFIVSLHMRRGDACGDPFTNDYQGEASLLDSKAQFGTPRLCYQTSVYLRAIERIRTLVPSSRPLHVYLATDDVDNVMDELTQHTTVVDQWHFLNYTRDHFQHYFAVEEAGNEGNQPMLGETAVTDLWLLSHGHAFVGHLGSRFGKVAWLLATARRNDFVPFFSVDGHSYCCEIDENCGKVKPYITVENCLAFGHEYNGYTHKNYWKEGSMARKKHFLYPDATDKVVD